MTKQQIHILATGGLGYIGSHTVVRLIESGYRVSILDNLDNSSLEVLNRIEQLTNIRPDFYQGDVRDSEFLDACFSKGNFDAVIHYAGLKAVGESCEKPALYYDVNVVGSLRLLEVMQKYSVNNLVFSSTATVYGEPTELPLHENMPLNPISPYAKTKRTVEEIMTTCCDANTDLSAISLRYFNPIGAHPSGQIGEAPQDVPNNLMPYVTQVAVGRRPFLQVWGDDYDTHDGTGVRDYIHVMDLADAHIKALEYLFNQKGFDVCNIGVGRGYSVLDVVTSFEKENEIKIPYEIKARRDGDIAEFYADPAKAELNLGWSAQFGINDMVRDSWNWQKQNPMGYESE